MFILMFIMQKNHHRKNTKELGLIIDEALEKTAEVDVMVDYNCR